MQVSPINDFLKSKTAFNRSVQYLLRCINSRLKQCQEGFNLKSVKMMDLARLKIHPFGGPKSLDTLIDCCQTNPSHFGTQPLPPLFEDCHFCYNSLIFPKYRQVIWSLWAKKSPILKPSPHIEQESFKSDVTAQKGFKIRAKFAVICLFTRLMIAALKRGLENDDRFGILCKIRNFGKNFLLRKQFEPLLLLKRIFLFREAAIFSTPFVKNFALTSPVT